MSSANASTLRADEHLAAWVAWAERAGCCVDAVQELLPPPQVLREQKLREVALARAALQAEEERRALARAAREAVPQSGSRHAGATSPPAQAAGGMSAAEVVEQVEKKLKQRHAMLERLDALNNYGPDAAKMRSDLVQMIGELKGQLKRHLQDRIRELQAGAAL